MFWTDQFGLIGRKPLNKAFAVTCGYQNNISIWLFETMKNK